MRTGHAWRDGLASITCLVFVLMGLIAFDSGVRERAWLLASDASSGGVAPWRERFGALVNAVVQAARDRSIDNAPLLLFTVVGLVLVWRMLRT